MNDEPELINVSYLCFKNDFKMINYQKSYWWFFCWSSNLDVVTQRDAMLFPSLWLTPRLSLRRPAGFFGGNLPDYQRAEVMMFIMGKVPVYGTPCHTLDTVKIGWVTRWLSEDPPGGSVWLYTNTSASHLHLSPIISCSHADPPAAFNMKHTSHINIITETKLN